MESKHLSASHLPRGRWHRGTPWPTTGVPFWTVPCAQPLSSPILSLLSLSLAPSRTQQAAERQQQQRSAAAVHRRRRAPQPQRRPLIPCAHSPATPRTTT